MSLTMRSSILFPREICFGKPVEKGSTPYPRSLFFRFLTCSLCSRLPRSVTSLCFDVVIVAKDIDVLVLLVWAYSQYHVRHKWYLKYDAEKYADTGVICDSFGSDICSVCSAFHAITGCDTTSYFYRTGKLRIFKKVLADKTKLGLLESLEQDRKLTEDGINNVREIVRSVIYSGKDNEDYVETRIRLYKSLKSKSSMSWPPDPDSVVQVIKRAHCQAYVWYHCRQRIINQLDLGEC